MSAGSQVAVLSPARGRRRASRRVAEESAERPLLRLAAFGALALYGVLRWGAMLDPVPTWRLLALLGLALLFAGAGPALVARSRLAAVVAAVIALVALFPLSGYPFEWARHVRVTVTADAVGQGLAALQRIDVPYGGINGWVRAVIVLGAGVLLLDAALVLAFTPRALGDLRRAGAALPLLALAVVPSTLVRPGRPYLEGVLLFVLLAAFIWGERLRAHDRVAAAFMCVLAVFAAVLAAPALDQHKPWLSPESFAGTFTPAHLASFEWSQTYGPLRWPQTGREIFDVNAPHPEYWKVEDLDSFNGIGWSQLAAWQQPPLAAELGAGTAGTPAQRAAWTQTIKVTIVAISSQNLIASGFAAAPQHVPGTVYQQQSPGTFATTAGLGPGDTYEVQVYDPAPDPAELRSAGDQYPRAARQYLTLSVPLPVRHAPAGAVSAPIGFPAFHSDAPPQISPQARWPVGRSPAGTASANATALIERSPYARAYALAQQLAGESATPYGFVKKVLAYLSTSNGFVYDQDPPSSRYPIESFLFASKHGYCQQFSGAMALLLRMGGVPARVAAGFTTGSHNSATNSYVVTDTDAHDWVEAWFPGYGWVKFDPTPASAPARGGHLKASALPGGADFNGASKTLLHGLQNRGGIAADALTPKAGSSSSLSVIVPILLGLALLLLGLIVLLLIRGGRVRTPEQVLTELERALRRCGRPVAGGVTLATVEKRLRYKPDAAAYVRAIRLERFARASETPTPRQRRALRAELRAGMGLRGWLRALVAPAAAVDAPRTPTLPLMEDVYELYRRGTELLEAGHNHQAVVPLSRARDLAPDKTSIREALGRALFHAQRYERGR